MSDNSTIEWTDATWNVVTGCTKVSPGCDNCYAETFAERWRGTPGHHFENGFDLTLRPERMDLPLKWRKPKRIFVNSMSDLFHKDVPDEFVARVWQVMGATPQHTYQILTKRHARMKAWTNRWYSGEIPEPYDVRSIPGYEGYAVTTHGEVLGKRSDTRGGMKQEAGEQGHLRVMLYRDGQRPGKRELVHRLVLTAFVRPPHAGEQACHRNGDPSDNRLSNLYWGRQEDNWRDRLAHGNGRSYHKLSESQVTEIRQRHDGGQSAYSMAKDYGVSDTQIRNIVLNRQWATAHLVKVPNPAPARVVLDNCWLGVSVEDQKRADLRIPALLDTPAAVRWLSAEPLLGPIDLHGPLDRHGHRPRLTYWLDGRPGWGEEETTPTGLIMQSPTVGPRIDWVVVGGESGPGARPMHPAWARSIRDQCVEAGVAFHFKQHGAWIRRADAHEWLDPWTSSRVRWVAPDGATYPHGDFNGSDEHRRWAQVQRVGKKAAGRELDGRVWDEFPTTRTAVA